MGNLGKENFNDKMCERTLTMAVKVHELWKSRKITFLDRPVIHQLTRSSSSVAANFRAATRARSDAEFYSKICVVVEECDETQFWFNYLLRIGLITTSEIDELLNEIEQLVKIFTSIKKKMRDKIYPNAK
jgi:four helix bundle protein